MPKGNDRKNKTNNVGFGAVTVYEMIGRRKETGSQYSIVVADLGANIPDQTLDSIVDRMAITLGDQRDVTRAGVQGIAGTIVRGVGAQGAKAEVFLHNRKLVALVYAPYSKIKDRVGGTMTPRSNEASLDKPEEFFASLKFN